MKNIRIVCCLATSFSSFLSGVDQKQPILYKKQYISLLHERDKELINSNTLPDDTKLKLQELQKNDEARFDAVSVEQPSINLVGCASGNDNPQTLVMGNSYQLGGWSTVVAFCIGLGLGYLVLKK